MKILIACDKFKETLTGTKVNETIAKALLKQSAG